MGRSSWSANEEVRLLDAIEQFGFGNWEDIAKHIETRTPEGIESGLFLNRFTNIDTVYLCFKANFEMIKTTNLDIYMSFLR